MHLTLPSRVRLLALMSALAAVCLAPACAQAPATGAPADAAQALRGQRLFLRCAACHETGEPKVTKIGPHLGGIVGRTAGTLAGYTYSKGLASAGFTWDDDKLLAWLERPTAIVPDTTMAFEGMAAEPDRRALLAYLRTLR